MKQTQHKREREREGMPCGEKRSAFTAERVERNGAPWNRPSGAKQRPPNEFRPPFLAPMIRRTTLSNNETMQLKISFDASLFATGKTELQTRIGRGFAGAGSK